MHFEHSAAGAASEVPHVPQNFDPAGAGAWHFGQVMDTGVAAPATFIVRAWRDAAGRLHGVVERVATGEKARFQGADAMAALVREMVARPSRGDMSRG